MMREMSQSNQRGQPSYRSPLDKQALVIPNYRSPLDKQSLVIPNPLAVFASGVRDLLSSTVRKPAMGTCEENPLTELS